MPLHHITCSLSCQLQKKGNCLSILHNKLVLQCTESSLSDWFLIFNHIRRVLVGNSQVLPRSKRSPITPWCYIRFNSIVVVRLVCGNHYDYPVLLTSNSRKQKHKALHIKPCSQPYLYIHLQSNDVINEPLLKFDFPSLEHHD